MDHYLDKGPKSHTVYQKLVQDRLKHVVLIRKQASEFAGKITLENTVYFEF